MVLGKILSRISRTVRFSRKVGVAHGISINSVNRSDMREAQKIKNELWPKVISKESLLRTDVGGVFVGKAVYDSYLRITRSATVDLNDLRLEELFFEALLLLVVAEKYFNREDVRYVILGHAVYVNWQIISDLALKYDAKAFVTFNSRFPPFHSVNENRGLQTTDHSLYPKYFSSLAPEIQRNCLGEGKKLIEARLRGELDEGVGYMARSAYSGSQQVEELKKSCGGKPLIFMLHSFSDSPHIYEDMVFPDFWEWLVQTFDYIERHRLFEKYEIFVKPHPNRFGYEDVFIERLCKRYSFLNVLDDGINNAAFVDWGVAAVISVYGSVAPELTALGVPVILCGDNPTAAYDFAFNAHTKDEYFELIRTADTLEVQSEKRSQVYEFMFMHYIRTKGVSLSDYPFKRHQRGAKVNGYCRYQEFKYSEFYNTCFPYIQSYI